MVKTRFFKRILKIAMGTSIPLALIATILVSSPVKADPGTLGLLGGAWDHTEITVKINSNKSISPTVIVAVEGAVSDWNTAIDSEGYPISDFELVTIEKGKADIVISLRKGTSPATGVVGQTIPNIGRDGRFRNARIQVSGGIMGFGFSATLVGNIVRHELGHALGLGHADDPNDLMYPSLPGDASENPITISALDILGFATVHDWYPGDFEAPIETSVNL